MDAVGTVGSTETMVCHKRSLGRAAIRFHVIYAIPAHDPTRCEIMMGAEPAWPGLGWVRPHDGLAVPFALAGQLGQLL